VCSRKQGVLTRATNTGERTRRTWMASRPIAWRNLATKKRTELTIEIDRMIVVSSRAVLVSAWCAKCRQRVSMASADEAARRARVGTRTMFRLIEAEKVHFKETTDGRLLVCL